MSQRDLKLRRVVFVSFEVVRFSPEDTPVDGDFDLFFQVRHGRSEEKGEARHVFRRDGKTVVSEVFRHEPRPGMRSLFQPVGSAKRARNVISDSGRTSAALR